MSRKKKNIRVLEYSIIEIYKGTRKTANVPKLPTFLTKISNFAFWRKFQFLNKISIFWQRFQFLTKISIFDKDLEFRRKFQFLTTISIFDQNFDFWTKCRFSTKISTCDFNKIYIFTKISIFGLKYAENLTFVSTIKYFWKFLYIFLLIFLYIWNCLYINFA